MKSLKLSLITVAILSMSGASALQAETQNNYSVAVELARTAKVNALIDNINALNDNIRVYSYQTGDISPTKSEINAFFGITNDAWKNYNGDQIDLTVDGSKVTLDNIFTTPPSDIVKNTFTTSEKLPVFSSTTTDLATISIPLSADFRSFYTLTEKLQSDPNIQISSSNPTDTTKIWYQPTGTGGYEIFNYDTANNKWNSLGTTGAGGSGTSGSGSNQIVVTSVDDLNNLPATTGATAMVSDGTIAEEYVYDGSAWVKTSSASSEGGVFNGTGSVPAMATTLITKAGGSIVDTPAPNGEWAGSKQFTKKDDIATGGYWISDDNQFVVTKDITALHNLSNLFLTGTTAWIANGSGTWKLKKETFPDSSIAWVYQAGDYSDVLNYDVAQSDAEDGYFIRSNTHNELLHYANGIFSPYNGSTYLTKDASARNIFTPTAGKAYLTTVNDCTVSTCNGDTTTSYYAGAKIDNLYAYYPTSSGNMLNGLTDAQPSSNWSDFWTNQLSAILWTGATYGDVQTGDVLVKTTINGSIVYQDATNYVNKANGYFIPDNKLPAGLTADTVNITKHTDGLNYVDVPNLDTFVTDISLPDNYPVNLSGSGFTNLKVQKCSTNLWSDNCTTPASATMVVTDGSRSNLPAPTNASRINLTKQVGSEPNYTTTGVAYNSDTSYKQWFYSTSGTIINDMLDAYATTNPYGDATAKSIGYAVKNNTVGRYNVKRKGLWTLLSDSTKTLDQTFSSWRGNTNEIAGVANNGLIYTRDDISPFTSAYRMGKIGICAVRGMRLPTLAETRASSSNGVPSNSKDWTWSASSWTSNTNFYWLWNGSSTGSSSYDKNFYVRCVR